MTFNIRVDLASDGENAWPKRKEIAASMIRFHDADLVGLQEALPGQLADLQALLPQFGRVGVGRGADLADEASAILYRTERFDFVASPRHADGVVVTGPVTRNLETAVHRTVEAIPEPRVVIAVAATPGTFRTSFGLVETSGAPVTVRASVAVDTGRSLVTALSRDFAVPAGRQLFAENLVRAIVGEGRETELGELHGLQLVLEVVSGSGSVLPFVIVTDNQGGDSLLRID